MAKQGHSLSTFIPSSLIVREKVAELEEELEKLRILLKVAEEIEAVDDRLNRRKQK